MGPERPERTSEFPPALGPYRLEYVLGHGGMGRVFAAVHEKTGESVALKTVVTRTLSTVAALHQEISILSRLRHPGIIGLRESGATGGIPWYAMDAVQGPSLQDIIVSRAQAKHSRSNNVVSEPPRLAPTGRTLTGGFFRDDSTALSSRQTDWATGLTQQDPTPILEHYLGADDSPFMELFLHLGAAVAHLHEKGIRHGDLKPDNLLLMGVARPLLVDLGVAGYSVAGRERLDLNLGNIGTVAYMAPEQLRQGHADTRSDLYAIGCMMYECFAGRHPFSGDNPREIRRAHLATIPTRLRDLAPELPSALESFVMRLIEKDPKDRPADVDELLAILDAPNSQSSWPPHGSTTPRLFRSSFQGRKLELQALNNRLLEALDGNGSMTWVVGERGIGKTRFLNELAGSGRAQKFTVLLLKQEQVSEHMLSSFVSQLIASFEEDGFPLPGSAERALAELESAGTASPTDLEGKQTLRSSLLRATAETVYARTRSKPVLVLVDDVEKIDELAEELLSMLRRKLQNRHLAIVCAQTIRDGSDENCLRLPPLDGGAIGNVARSMLGTDSLPSSFCEFLHNRSMGNPMLVAEWLRHAVFEGVLTHRRSAGWSVRELMPEEFGKVVSTPDLLIELVSRRLAGLSRDCHRILKIASVLGDCFSQELLRTLDTKRNTNNDAEHHQALGELLLAGVLERSDIGWLRFVDPTLSETLARDLSTGEVTAVHLEAAGWLETRVDANPQLAEEYAVHLVGAKRPERAPAYFELAAQVAAHNLRFRDSERLYQRALNVLTEFPTSDSQAVEARLNETLGDVATRLKHKTVAMDAYESCLKLCHAQPIRVARLERKLAAVCHEERMLVRKHLALADKALSMAGRDEEGWLFESIEVQLTKMLNSYFEGDLANLLELAASLNPTVQTYGTPRQFGLFLSHRAAANMRAGRYQSSPEIFMDLAQALETQISADDHPAAATTRFLMCLNKLCSFDEGGADLNDARHGFEQALAIARIRDDVVLQMRASTYLSIAVRRLGEVSACARLSASLLALEKAHPEPDYRGAAQANLAWVSFRNGNFEESEQLAVEAFQIWDGADSRFPFQWVALFPLLGALGQDPARCQMTYSHELRLEVFLGDPKQSWLPDELTQALRQVVSGGDRSSALRAVVHLGELYGLL